MKDPWRAAQLIAFYSVFHFAARQWQEKTESGRAFKTFCQTWRTDSFLHLILCAGTVFIWAVVAIFALGMGLHYLGI